MKPIVLVVNDDGITAPGIQVLAKSLDSQAEVWVVAPHQERSAQGMALTVTTPLTYQEVGVRQYAVTGTPVDCVFMAFDQILPRNPDWVVSGINRGGNLGSDTLYSGTVSAANEAALRGVRSIAISCERVNILGDEERSPYADGLHYDTAGKVAAEAFRSREYFDLPLGRVLNINVPSIKPEALKGMRPCKLGRRTYHHKLVDAKNPRGQNSFWIGGVPDFIPDEGTDCVAVHEGYVSLSILKPSYEDITLTDALELELTKKIMDGVHTS